MLILSIGKYGGIAQLARAFGSYPKCRRFKSYFRYHIRPGGQAVKTPPFHGGNTSSILVRVTKHFLRQHRYKVRCCFTKCRCGGIGRHKGLKIPRTNTPYRFKSGHRHQKNVSTCNLRSRHSSFLVQCLQNFNDLLTYKKGGFQPPFIFFCNFSKKNEQYIIIIFCEQRSNQ